MISYFFTDSIFSKSDSDSDSAGDSSSTFDQLTWLCTDFLCRYINSVVTTLGVSRAARAIEASTQLGPQVLV